MLDITWIHPYRKNIKIEFFPTYKYFIIGTRPLLYLLQIDNYDKQLLRINYCEDKLNRWKMYFLNYIKDVPTCIILFNEFCLALYDKIIKFLL